MTGILLVDKPAGFTSFDVVAKLRGMLQERRVGHAGTLDPMATGVLPLFFGRATKACDLLPCSDKRYTAVLRLGLVTDTQDITGTVLEQHPVLARTADVERALLSFQGVLSQLPPMYSAIQVNGRRLYDIAREGKTVERPSREIAVYAAHLLAADEEKHEYTVDFACSKGTYVRTLCHDIGAMLGCGAALAQLRRTEASGWGLAGCHTLAQLQAAADEKRVDALLLPLQTAFEALPRVTLDEKRTRLFCNGVPLEIGRNHLPRIQGRYTVYARSGAFLGVAHNDDEAGELKLDQLFWEKDSI